MREFWISENKKQSELGEELVCDYVILIEDLEQVSCESYGIQVTLRNTGETKRIRNLTINQERILALAEILCRNMVTPCSLADVVADWL